jgi:fumarate hydratase class II
MPDEGERRTEKDALGEVKVPARALFGAATQRAVENFPSAGCACPAASSARWP